MRIRVIALLIMVIGSNAGAQIPRPRIGLSQPVAWASLGAGYQQGYSVQNGNQIWDFGDGMQYIASLEKPMSSAVTVGVLATTARIPVRVTTAGSGTDADANISQLFAALHISNGGQFHTLFDFRAGATFYSSFTGRTIGSSLGLNGLDTDFSFALGYGFGYSFTPRFSLDVVQDVTTSVHQKDGLSAGTDNSARIHSTRLIARMALGGR